MIRDRNRGRDCPHGRGDRLRTGARERHAQPVQPSPLTVVYLLSPDDPHLTRARLSISSVRHHDPDVRIVVLVVAEADVADAPGLAGADEVRVVAPLHRDSGYFQDNCRHLGQVDADRILYLDTDTIAFGSVVALATRFADVDVAAPASPWVGRLGYHHWMAPDIPAPLNGGVVLMSRAFCAEWTAGIPDRHRSLMTDPRRRDLAAWLRSVSAHGYHRHEFVLAEAAFSGRWTTRLMAASDCHLLERWPAQEDPAAWAAASVLHTYATTWSACVEILRSADAVPPDHPVRSPEWALAAAGDAVRHSSAEDDRRFDQRWTDWLVGQLLDRRPPAQLVDVIAERGFSRAYAEQVVAEAADSPIFLAAARRYRPKAKLASWTELAGRVQARGGLSVPRLEATPAQFYRDFFHPGRPVVLTGLMDGWPARRSWSVEHFRARYGAVEVEITQGRAADGDYERHFVEHRRSVPLARYLDMITAGGPTNDYYLVAQNHVLDLPGLRPLLDDIPAPSGFLDPERAERPHVRLWLGPAGTVTPLHCDDRSVLFGQVFGRKHVRLVPPQFLASLYNDHGCHSAVDLAGLDFERFPAMRDVPVLDVFVEAGEFLFIPFGWWHWVQALNISASLTFTNFYVNGPPAVWSQASR